MRAEATSRRTPRAAFRVAAFLALGAGVQIAVPAMQESAFFRAYAGGIAAAAAGLLRFVRQPASSSAGLVEVSGFKAEIRTGCDAIVPMALFASAVLLAPASRRARAVGLLGGVPLLAGLNVVRVATLAWTGSSRPQWFERIHVDAAQPVFFLVTIGLWFAWAAWAGMSGGPKHDPAA